jgi:glycosyltransferase involved in cell wall biosynthesis
LNLHLIAFDIPYPPNYGGVIDIFYKIKALHESGVKIHLHCFQYRGKKPAPALEEYCRAVYYYPRKLSLKSFFNIHPFIVQTRRPAALLRRLIEQSYPILFEGVHTSAFIGHPELSSRLKLLRMHNIEWQYYRRLARLEKNHARAIYLYLESMKLKWYEPRILSQADVVLPISPADERYFRQWGPCRIRMLPAFHGHRKVTSQEGIGAYALFHGNLSVPDNQAAARFLIKKVFRGLDYPLYIAGRAPANSLVKLCRAHEQVRLFPDPSDSAMEKLVREAHINLLYTYQSEGIKIKLLESLFAGRFCIVNERMVKNSGLEPLCRIANSADAIRQAVQELKVQPFTSADFELRRRVLSERYADEKGAKIILGCLKDVLI